MTLESLQEKGALQFLAQAAGDDGDDAEKRGTPDFRSPEPRAGSRERCAARGKSADDADQHPNHQDGNRHQEEAEERSRQSADAGRARGARRSRHERAPAQP